MSMRVSYHPKEPGMPYTVEVQHVKEGHYCLQIKETEYGYENVSVHGNIDMIEKLGNDILDGVRKIREKADALPPVIAELISQS